MKIVITTDERHGRIRKALVNMGVEIVREKLDAGDYEVCGEPYFLVERKSIRDLMSSTKSGRLWEQLRKLKEIEERENGNCIPVVLIEESPARVVKVRKGRRGWNPQSVIGVMHSIQFDWHIPYIYAPSWWWSALSLVGLAKFTEESDKVRKVRLGKKPKDMNEAVLYITEGFPFVGPVSGRKLLEEFHNVRGIANASIADLLRVLNEKQANFMWRILRHEYKGGLVKK